jgi:hypothetical protein
METIFQIANLLTMPFWLLMIFAPHWRWTRRIMATMWPLATAVLIYSLLVLPQVPALLPQLANPALEPIARLLGTPEGATIGWVHFLAFDLFVGRWAYLDSRQRGLGAVWASPILFLILMFGPLGLLLYLGVRRIRTPQLAPSGEFYTA